MAEYFIDGVTLAKSMLRNTGTYARTDYKTQPGASLFSSETELHTSQPEPVIPYLIPFILILICWCEWLV